MTRQLESSQIERIIRALSLEASTEVDPSEKKAIRETAYTFIFLIAPTHKDRLLYTSIYESSLKDLELKQ